VTGERVCPDCGELDPVRDGAPAWPPGWSCRACGQATSVVDGIPLTAPSLADTVAAFPPDRFAVLARIERNHFWFVPRRRLILSLATRHAPQARSVLEVGCGSGNVIAALAASRSWARVVGLDLHPSGLSVARATLPATVELIQADARAIPFRAAFDLAGAFDVLEHVVEDEAIIAGVRAALVDNGVFLAAVPQHPTLWSAADDVAHHVRRYQRGELEAKLARNGFEVLFSSSYAVVLLPLMAVSRRASRKSGASEEESRRLVESELQVSSVVNRMLSAMLHAEVALTQRGMRWPIGGSRVVVSRRI
jgi:SAM-dependent methyltransferase